MFWKVDKSILRQFSVALISDLLIIDNGLHEGWPAPMLPKFGKSDPVQITPRQAAIIVNMIYIGTGVGSLFLLLFMNRFGRKTILFASALPKIAAWILLIFAETVPTIYVARFLCGLSHGIIFTLLSVYQCELASKHIRGVLGALMSELINISVLVMYGLGIWLSRPTVSIISVCIPALFCLCFTFCPESSYFLVRKNELRKAERILQWVLNQKDVTKELEEVKRIVAIEDEASGTSFTVWAKEAMAKKENRRASLVGFILATSLSFSGCGPILAYQSNIFQVADFALDKDLSMLSTGFANIVGGIVCILVVKQIGKRTIMMIAAPMVSFSLMAVAAFFSALEGGWDVTYFRWIPTVFLFVYMFAYGFALYPVVYTYVGEIFSYEMKKFAATAFALHFSIFSVATVEFYQFLNEKYGIYMPFWCFSVITIVLWLLMYVYVPETEGKSLEEILIELRGIKGNDKLPQREKNSRS